MQDLHMTEKNSEDSKKLENSSPPDKNEEHPTSYMETIVHLFKGNIGPGLFAMGDAFKNGGLIVSPVLTIVIALISVHCQHILLNCSKRVKVLSQSEQCPDYAETVGQCFEIGPPKLRSWATHMRTIVNIFICVTQLGFCCIYFVFISTNLEQILKHHGYHWNVHLIMLIAFIPILLTCLITNLKYLTPVSLLANLSMVSGLVLTMYFAFKGGLPAPSERHYLTNAPQLALFFGTAIFAFEGIALVLPLKNAMKRPNNFDRRLGVLNVGMTFVAFAFIFAGFFGYLKWGDDVGGSLTLNLGSSWLAQVVQLIVSLGVLLGYPLQFFVAIQIMFPAVQQMFKLNQNSIVGELVFRTAMVVITLAIAELVPKLSLFISLIGALCSTALALVFPPLIELIVRTENSKGPGVQIFAKNIFILILALLGFSTGTYESISAIIKEFQL
ncbi:proton-coupled amino acid transporter 1 [Eupeodes corollae]|uniref:proton-coupled amino acid transporter 1 n=1 Tax=Eupeodes corollae TaxID=290404 RepID=UPI002490AA9F|nr:proton-coupled amino acid transporter 1 [Eupeodes corollae]